MKIGVRDDCIAGCSLQEKMWVLKGLGYDFMELTFTPEMIDNLTKEDVRNYQRMVNETGIPFITTSVGHFPGFATMTIEKRKVILEQLKKVIDITALLGGEVILLATKESSDDVNEYCDIYKNELKEIADYAQERNIYLALEPVGRFKTNVLGKLVRKIEHPAIGLYYDMGNCIFAGEEPVEQLRVWVDIVKAIHIKGAREISVNEMPLYAILNILNKKGFSGPGCIEIGPKDGSNTHLADVLKVLQKFRLLRNELKEGGPYV